MTQQDWQTILKTSIIVIGTTAIITFDLPQGEAVTTILIGRGLLSLVYGVIMMSVDTLVPEPSPLRLTPQTQLFLWGVGLFSIALATNWLQWSAPTVGFWIFQPVALTFPFHKGFRWLWSQVSSTYKNQF